MARQVGTVAISSQLTLKEMAQDPVDAFLEHLDTRPEVPLPVPAIQSAAWEEWYARRKDWSMKHDRLWARVQEFHRTEEVPLCYWRF